ncbi:MFS transporter [Lactobacillus sp. R2/2]|nr:MFS transporter [Lactobacillus sp. R2/2]MEB3363826.1 MFS transporter [Lactobacillus sp. R2/2]
MCSTTLIAMNLALYTINNWIPTIFVNNGITVTKSLLMTTIMIVAAPLGTYFSTFIIEFLPRKLFGGIFIIAIAILGYIYAQQRSEASILIIGFIMIFILYIYNSFSSAVYATELWPTQVKMRGLGISNAIGRFVAITSPYLIAWILTDFGVVAVFITLGILLGLCALIIILFGIETRKKTINEIDSSINLESNREVNHA